ncbi:molybdenum cofactor synthesis domain-containing protein [Bacteroidota bacterium]
MVSFTIKSLNISEKKGTIKSPADRIEIDLDGVKGDAHAGKWHRQVSLLGTESYEKVARDSGMELSHGTFAENITTEGLILHETKVFDRFVHDDVILEVTQIGKKCHSGCEIQKKIGNCIMPIEGIFTKVIQGGILKKGDQFKYIPREIKVHIITLSDRAFKGEYSDRSGPQIEKIISEFLESNKRIYKIIRTVLPDRKEEIEKIVRESVDAKTDIIITTGGTGIGPRDITPDVIKPILEKEIPGIMEHIRVKYGSEKPNALISRSIAGVAGSSLIYVLPGSVKAVNEYMSEITPTIEHSMRMLYAIDSH